MGWVHSEDFKRILEMGKELERIKKRDATEAEQNRVLRRRDKVDYWFTFLLCIAVAIIILLASLRLIRDLGI